MFTLPDFSRMTLWFTPSPEPLLQKLTEVATSAADPGDPNRNVPATGTRAPVGGRVIGFRNRSVRSAA